VRLGRSIKLAEALTWVLVAVLLAGSGTGASAQPEPVLGRWLSESGKGVVEIFPCADRLCGRLVWLQETIRDGAPARDRNNPDPALRTRPECGLVMLGDFRRLEANRWGDGWIYSPENGKTYHAKLKVPDADTLDLRGYVGIPLFGETQHWKRDAAKRPSCAG
jgi:uncharacterized protein (DUF2147 family)